MNTKITFLLLLILLVILMLFYYADVESNIIILLAIAVVILMHNIIYKKEYFISEMEAKADTLDEKITMLITLAKALQPNIESIEQPITSIEYNRSCPFRTLESSDTGESSGGSTIDRGLLDVGINLPFGSTLDSLNPDQLLSRISPPN